MDGDGRSAQRFGFESTTDDVLAGVDLGGRTMLVTGASTGLGEETTRALAAHGATVVMAVRDPVRGKAAAERIRATAGAPVSLEIRQLDLASLDSVRRFSGEFLAARSTLDVLINNAGLMACPFGLTQDGHELQWGTNHLGHFLLANLLRPALLGAERSRVVSLSSRGHSFSDIDLSDPRFDRGDYTPFVGYGRAKTANALFAVGWDRRFGDQGSQAFSVHPGGIHTELGRNMTPETIAMLSARLAEGGRVFQWKTIPQGAATSVWAATAPALEAHGGAYLEDCHVARLAAPGDEDGVLPYAIDPASADRLWDYSLAAVGLA